MATTVEELVQELEQEAQTTRRVLERVPDDQMDWRPHEKSLTLGQLAMHVATLPGALAEVSMRSFDVNTEIPRPTASSTDGLLETLARSVAGAKALLLSMGDAGLAAPWTLVDGEREVFSVSRAVFLRSTMLNHWYHHRGQLTVYLRQVGALVPAIYGDSADEKLIPA
jgi:uncharacterized damage-inducible protein DinB